MSIEACFMRDNVSSFEGLGVVSLVSKGLQSLAKKVSEFVQERYCTLLCFLPPAAAGAVGGGLLLGPPGIVIGCAIGLIVGAVGFNCLGLQGTTASN